MIQQEQELLETLKVTATLIGHTLDEYEFDNVYVYRFQKSANESIAIYVFSEYRYKVYSRLTDTEKEFNSLKEAIQYTFTIL